MIEPCREACPFFFAEVSAAKKNKGFSLRPRCLCGKKALFKRHSIERIEQFKDLRSEFREFQNKLRYMQTEIKTYHTSVTTLAQESQVHQEKMINATKEAKKIKEEADEAHAEIIALNGSISAIRKELDGLTQGVKKLSSELGEEIQAARRAKKVEAKRVREQKLDAKAEEILKRYEDGSKLTLDEFKVLMERGLI